MLNPIPLALRIPLFLILLLLHLLLLLTLVEDLLLKNDTIHTRLEKRAYGRRFAFEETQAVER